MCQTPAQGRGRVTATRGAVVPLRRCEGALGRVRVAGLGLTALGAVTGAGGVALTSVSPGGRAHRSGGLSSGRLGLARSTRWAGPATLTGRSETTTPVTAPTTQAAISSQA